MTNHLIQSTAVDMMRKSMHHEYTCEDCKLCEDCMAGSDNPMFCLDAVLFVCSKCQLCEKSHVLSDPISRLMEEACSQDS